MRNLLPEGNEQRRASTSLESLFSLAWGARRRRAALIACFPVAVRGRTPRFSSVQPALARAHARNNLRIFPFLQACLKFTVTARFAERRNKYHRPGSTEITDRTISGLRYVLTYTILLTRKVSVESVDNFNQRNTSR